jgi:hypothetical protein
MVKLHIKENATRIYDVQVRTDILDAIIAQGYCHTRPESASAYLETLIYEEDEELYNALRSILNCTENEIATLINGCDVIYLYT